MMTFSSSVITHHHISTPLAAARGFKFAEGWLGRAHGVTKVETEHEEVHVAAAMGWSPTFNEGAIKLLSSQASWVRRAWME